MSLHGEYADETFRELDLESAEVVESEFLDCAFERCTLARAVFRNCRFINCVFDGCDLSLLQVPGSAFSLTRFSASKLIGIDWTQADWDAPRMGRPIAFAECVLSHGTFLGLALPGLPIRDSVAHEADFREADLSGADFSGTDLEGSLFSATRLRGADFRTARNFHIVPGQNDLAGARFALPEALALLYAMEIELDHGEE